MTLEWQEASKNLYRASGRKNTTYLCSRQLSDKWQAGIIKYPDGGFITIRCDEDLRLAQGLCQTHADGVAKIVGVIGLATRGGNYAET